MMTFKTGSPSETIRLGQKIGRLLKAGDVAALTGGLGSGKTTLVKGIAKGLSVSDEKRVVSPTFVLIHEYEGREKVYHMDWYRLDSVSGEDQALVEECLSAPAVTLVEWAERGKDLLPKECLWIRLEHEAPLSRTIRLDAHGEKYKALLARLGGP